MGIYKWRDGARYSADVSKVAGELNALVTKTPEKVVEAAENEQAEMHKCFTWDDTKAGHLYRLGEARKLIQGIITVDEAPDREPVEYRAFESVVIEEQRQYVPTKVALNDPDMREQVFVEIRQSIGELSVKAKMYRYLAEKEFDKVQHHLELAREAVTV
jgi:hypothetical protein